MSLKVSLPPSCTLEVDTKHHRQSPRKSSSCRCRSTCCTWSCSRMPPQTWDRTWWPRGRSLRRPRRTPSWTAWCWCCWCRCPRGRWGWGASPGHGHAPAVQLNNFDIGEIFYQFPQQLLLKSNESITNWSFNMTWDMVCPPKIFTGGQFGYHKSVLIDS